MRYSDNLGAAFFMLGSYLFSVSTRIFKYTSFLFIGKYIFSKLPMKAISLYLSCITFPLFSSIYILFSHKFRLLLTFLSRQNKVISLLLEREIKKVFLAPLYGSIVVFSCGSSNTHCSTLTTQGTLKIFVVVVAVVMVVVVVAVVTDLIPTTSPPPPPPLHHTPPPSTLLTTCCGFLLSRTGGARGVSGWVEGVQGGGGGQDTGVFWMGVEEIEGVAGVVTGEDVWGYM